MTVHMKHYKLRIWHLVLQVHMNRYTLQVSRYPLDITHYTLPIKLCPLDITHSRYTKFLNYSLQTTHTTLHICSYTLHITNFTLTTIPTQHTTHYILHTTNCTLHIMHYTLHTLKEFSAKIITLGRDLGFML